MITLLREVSNALFGGTEELDEKLLEAVDDGDLASVKAWLEQGADIEARDEYGYTPLFLAVILGNTEILNVLLAEGASVNVRNRSGQTPLHRACSGEAVTRLLARGADIEARDNYGNTPLFSYCHKDDLEMFKRLLDAGACVNARDDAGRTPLHDALSGEIVQELLARGADIEAKDNNEATPLIAVMTKYDSLEAVKALLATGANIEASDKFQRTPLHFAASKECYDLGYLEVLLSEGANLETRQEVTQWTPLHLAAKSGSGKKVQLLVAEGADCKARDWHRDTPLNFAKAHIGNWKVRLAEAGRFDSINRNNEPDNFQPLSLQACARASIRSRLLEHKNETGQPLSESVPMLPLGKSSINDYVYKPLMGKPVFE
ncbi:ankyrin repeat domain-containing protein [Endozoicomonas sp. ONNA2]|uniref:ankyrin repeat domain-containing protein n=1 Tax=Endozoicomonas sp. ONNA2 TaxID=2828741 RepID=UPI002147BBA3|nr:ankyrin repeat domain-containing protein [Endozoicomonas sp. ONNA2]